MAEEIDDFYNQRDVLTFISDELKSLKSKLSEESIDILIKKVDRLESEVKRLTKENDKLKSNITRIEKQLSDEQLEVANICGIEPIEYAIQLMKYNQLKVYYNNQGLRY